jgi:hypothetical protein
MTRLTFDPSLLDYQQTMAELVDELRDEKTDSRAKPPLPREPWQTAYVRKDLSALSIFHAGLLPPPQIERLDVSTYEGQADDIIQINTCDEFGVEGVHVSIRDDQGNLLESDYVLPNPDFTGHWVYFATVSIPSGTRITICVKAMDGLGAMGVKTCRMTIP